MNVDTTTLTKVITQCFGYSSDGRFTDEQQTAFLVEGKRLRGLLLNLLSAQFNEGTPEVIAANTQLTIVNTSLSDAVATLANAATTLKNVAALVKTLDGLLSIADSFL
jgi:hypothetical protein